jgi:hypothetical protein
MLAAVSTGNDSSTAAFDCVHYHHCKHCNALHNTQALRQGWSDEGPGTQIDVPSDSPLAVDTDRCALLLLHAAITATAAAAAAAAAAAGAAAAAAAVTSAAAAAAGAACHLSHCTNSNDVAAASATFTGSTQLLLSVLTTNLDCFEL